MSRGRGEGTGGIREGDVEVVERGSIEGEGRAYSGEGGRGFRGGGKSVEGDGGGGREGVDERRGVVKEQGGEGKEGKWRWSRDFPSPHSEKEKEGGESVKGG